MTITAVRRTPADAETMTADEAIAALYRAQWATMVRLAYLLVRDEAAAEDVVADALVNLHRHWDDLADPALAVGYLRRSVVNGSRSVMRHRRVQHDKLGLQAARDARRHVPSAEESALGRLGGRLMLDALDHLPRRQREVLVLRYFLDLSEAQIATTLEISPGSVKAHASRGITALRAALAGPTPEGPHR